MKSSTFVLLLDYYFTGEKYVLSLFNQWIIAIPGSQENILEMKKTNNTKLKKM